jgi:DNA-binding transcriptional LysR family regulator
LRDGAGIVRLPEYLVGEDLASGRLVRLLRKVSTSRRTVSLLVPSRSYVPPRVRAFASALTQELRPAFRRS